MDEEEIIISNEVVRDTSREVSSVLVLLKTAWRMYKAQWKTFALIMLAPLIASLVLGGIVAFGDFTATGLQVESMIVVSVVLILALLVVVTAIIVQMWGTLTLIYAAVRYDERLQTRELYKQSRSMLLPFFGITILSSIMTFGGFVLFIIPGIFFTVAFAFSMYILVAENRRGMDALLTSREYVRGRWWQVFGRILGVIAIYILLSLILSLIKGIVGDTIHSILEFVMVFITTPILILYLYLLYREIRGLSEAVEPTEKERKVFLGIGIVGTVLFYVIIALMGLTLLSL